MAKYLKKYNKQTGKWEIVSEPVVDVVQQLGPDSMPISDDNVIVTNPYHTVPSGGTDITLYEALSNIGDDISKLQRNVSWLAEHGGGGGGGGGSTSVYGISVIEPVADKDHAVYISGTSLNVSFMITGGTEGEIYQYRYTFDGNVMPYSACTNQTTVTFKIANIHMVTQNTSHTLIISALNEEGLNIPSVSIRIYESSLTIKLNGEKNEILNNEVLMSLSNKTGSVYFDVKNALIGSMTVIKYTCNGVTAQEQYENPAVEIPPVPINIWKVLSLLVNCIQ